MPSYSVFVGNDGKYYYRQKVEGKSSGANYIPPSESVSGAQNTLALLMAALRAQVFADTGYSEVQV